MAAIRTHKASKVSVILRVGMDEDTGKDIYATITLGNGNVVPNPEASDILAVVGALRPVLDGSVYQVTHTLTDIIEDA